jgi:hypothetical protein
VPYDNVRHSTQLHAARKDIKEKQAAADKITLTAVLQQMDAMRVRVIQRAIDERTSSWLNVLPIERNGFDLTADEFRDALAIRYRRPLLRCPTQCDGCGAQFSMQHALACKKGGLVTRRHNEIRDVVGDLAALAWKDVHREPVVREASDDENLPALVADLAVRGAWQPQRMALLDIRVTDTDATSYASQPVRSVLAKAESEKKRKYGAVCEQRHASFTPFVISVDGALGREANAFVHRLVDHLVRKWQRSFSETANWVRTRLAFAVLRATGNCIRGSRSKWRSLGLEDGAAIKSALD